VCENHGEPAEVYNAHNRTDFQACAYHVRHPKELRKKVTRDDGADLDDLGAAELREHFPSPTKRGGRPDVDTTPPPKSKATDEILSIVDDKAISESSLIMALYSGKMAQSDVRQVLDLRMLDADDDKVEKRIAKSIKIAKEWTPSEADAPKVDETDSGKELTDLQKRHGKRVGTLAASHKHVLYEMHQSKRSSVKEMLFDPDTNRPVLRASVQDDISDWHILHIVLIDFLYVCVGFGYLNDEESRALHRWASRRGSHGNSCTVVFRTIRRLLALVDTDDTKQLGDIIKSEAKGLLDEELEFMPDSKSFQAGNVAGKGVRSDSQDSGWTLKAGHDKGLAVPFPRKEICWWWTNNAKCEDLDSNGDCKWARFHNNCGKRCPDPKVPGAFFYCKDKHRATECPK
jgi:hypothetical protein